MLEDTVRRGILEFNDLLNRDIFISKKKIDSVFDRYNDVFNYVINHSNLVDNDLYKDVFNVLNCGYSLVSMHNDCYLSRHLVLEKEYFDNMFRGIDDSIVLDIDQRKAILADEDYSLIVAGAGSGKTTTMAAKVKYLIDKVGVLPSKIIILAFTNKAKEELEFRINEQFKLGVEVLTFHKLGMKFIRRIFDYPVRNVGDGVVREILDNYVRKVVFPDKDKLREFMGAFPKYVRFDTSVFDFDNFDDYFKDFIDKKYELYKDELDSYNKDVINVRRENNFTINGEFVKSSYEVDIANYLYVNGYDYKYEELYKYTSSDMRSYAPDFTIHDNFKRIYVEYYGLAKMVDGELDRSYAYNENIFKKRKLHKKYHTNLIELYNKSDYLLDLKRGLDKYRIKANRRSDKDIFYTLWYTNYEYHFFRFVNVVSVFIPRFKEKGYDVDDFDSIIDSCKDNNLKRQLRFVKEVFIYYQEKLHSNRLIDFSDMINYGYRKMDKVLLKDKSLDYDYLIIDEYQDISWSRYNFAKRLSDLFSAKIVAVGDDWQAIFGFSGSDVLVFTNFYNLMGYADIMKITKTYRNSQELIDIASMFVLKNTNQIKKDLTSCKHLDNPINLVYYDYSSLNSKSYAVCKIIKSIYMDNKEAKILLLGRYNDDIDDLLVSGWFVKGYDNRVIYKDMDYVYIDFMTIHEAKGLGYDYVIILNAINDVKGFPSQLVDEDIIRVLNPIDKGNINYPEERRLFYVAITRSKNKVYILCPNVPVNKRSEFVLEIRNYDNVCEVFDEELIG